MAGEPTGLLSFLLGILLIVASLCILFFCKQNQAFSYDIKNYLKNSLAPCCEGKPYTESKEDTYYDKSKKKN